MNAISQALIQLAQAFNAPANSARPTLGNRSQVPAEELAVADAFAEFLRQRTPAYDGFHIAEDGACSVCDAVGTRHLNIERHLTEEDFTDAELNGGLGGADAEFHTEWRDDLEATGHVPRNIVAGYVNDVTEAAILNAATLARIGRKWGLEEE